MTTEEVLEGLESIRNDYGIQGEEYEGEVIKQAIILIKAQKRKRARKNDSQDWSGAQGNDIERINERAKRSEWGIYG